MIECEFYSRLNLTNSRQLLLKPTRELLYPVVDHRRAGLAHELTCILHIMDACS